MKQYKRAKSRGEELERRRTSLLLDMRPAGARSQAASYTYHIQDVEASIEAQHKATADSIVNVLDMMSYLQDGTLERDIIELRYIDGLSWGTIERRRFMSRSQAAEYERRGIDKLLSFQRVQKIISDYSE